MTEIGRYAHHPSWLRFRALLAERLALRVETTPEESQFEWEGHTIHLDTWPAADVKGVVILVHGGGGHGRLLAPLGNALSARGYRCLAPDLPGYGLTLPRPGWRPSYADWPRLLAELVREQPLPVGLFGLSMGGMTAVFASQQAKVSALVATTLLDLSNPVTFRRASRHPLLGVLSQLGFSFFGDRLDRITLPLGLVAPMRALSSDPELAEYFATDSLLGGRRVPLGLFRTAAVHRAPTRCEAPLALFHPGADIWTPTAWSLATFERLRARTKRFEELPGGAHAPFEAEAFRALVDSSDRFFRQHFSFSLDEA